MIHKCDRCAALENEIYRLEHQLAEANERAAKATDLMMKGESLRGKLMLGSILGGAFETDAKKSQMVYIMTGKKL